MLVSVIIPAYKQEETIENNIRDIYEAMSRTRWNFEVIVVVDGFTDNTFSEASKVSEDNVYVIGYEQNRGKGYAVKFGMAQAKGDLIAFIDAGMEINPNSISMLLEHMEWYDADVVVGSKRHVASKVNYSFLRKVYSWVYYTAARIMFGLKIGDVQTGLKVYKKEVLDAVLPRLLIKQFAFDIEMLAVANRLGYKRIYDAPVEIVLDFTGSTFGKTILLDPFIQRMIIDTMAVFYRLKILKYYDDGNSHKWLQNDISQLIAASIKLPKISNPEFSIIIPARTINKSLKEAIMHLKKLDYPNFEVILIFDDNIKRPPDLDERFRIVSGVGNLGPGEKRNIGAEVADGNILAFLDDDAFPKRDWLSKASEIFKNSNVYALGAPAITPKDAGFLEKISGRLLESILVSGITVFRHKPMAQRLVDDYPTVNLFVRKDSFIEVGGFIVQFWPGEDTKLCLDLVSKYKRQFLYDPSPVVYHHRRNVLLPHLKQVSRYGQHRGQFSRLFPQTSRLISYFVPTFFILGLVTGPILSYFYPPLWYLYFFTIGLYAFLILKRAIRVGFDEKSILAIPLMVVGIFSTHLIYGINFVIGLIRRPKLELRTVDFQTGRHLEG